MISTISHKIEYGDFQTPLELAEMVCNKLVELRVNPDVIIEPTCGIGNFIQAAALSFPNTNKIIGIDINSDYIEILKKTIITNKNLEIKHEDFFQFDWFKLINQLNGELLILGNFPWVTNSQQGIIGGKNLPKKNNFQKHNGLEAITGKSNFDISEWMLIQVIDWLQKRNAHLAMLCKVSVARKLLSYIHNKKLNLADCAIYKIDAKKYFDANVEACLFFCKFDLTYKNYFCNVFSSLQSRNYECIGYRNNVLIKDIKYFDKLSNLYNNTAIKWRSGIKHDCSNVMEFHQVNDTLINGLGEVVHLEKTYLFPLMKGSCIAQNKTKNTDKYVLVTQKYVGEWTDCIEYLAPKTWNYLKSHASYLERRKSRIYQNNPKFSIFGVGAYTFAPWKIAICGLYKKLNFRLINTIDDKPVIFDDTVYFLSFEDEESAHTTFQLLTSSLATDFYSSLIFWDEKRPIKSSVLNSLNLTVLAEMLKN